MYTICIRPLIFFSYAAKHLPFGYGASTKIEDVADSDDDEEEYGEHQVSSCVRYYGNIYSQC